MAVALPSGGAMLWTIWIAGALLAIARLLLSLGRVRRLARHASALEDASWQRAADTLGERLGLRRRVRLVVSDAVHTPMAGGTWNPIVFLPAEAVSWDAERRHIVLAHELAHLASHDPLRLVGARLALGLYWFHPLAWLAAKQSSVAREQACDEKVLDLGVLPSAYAQALLDLAERLSPAPRVLAALAMVEPSLLEKRIMAILNNDVRPAGVRRPIALALCVAVITLSVAASRPAARSVTVTTPPLVFAATTVETLAPRLAAPVASDQAAQLTSRDTACSSDDASRGTFSGFTNIDNRGVISEQIGTGGGYRIIQRHFDDLLVCMRSEDVTGSDRPSEWLGRAPRVVIETRRGGSTQSLETVRQAGGVQQTWRINGVDHPFDAAAQAWRTAVLAVLDRTWEVSSLRGQVSSLRGEISSLRGEESSLRGDIASLRGEVSSMRGHASSLRGEESTLRGEISSIMGHESSLRGEIASERGSISSLAGSRYDAGGTERAGIDRRIKDHEVEIARIERDLRDYNADAKVADVERRLQALNTDGKIAAVETEIRTFDEQAKVQAVERQIAALNVNDKTAEVERRIDALDAERRTRQLDDRLADDVKRLSQAIGAIK